MQEEIYTVIAAIKNFIANNEPHQAAPIMAQVTFKNEIKQHSASTAPLLHKAVEQLKASNRGPYPETTARALDIATQYLEDNGVILIMNCETS
jgi:effector-binding domain-containing protein